MLVALAEATPACTTSRHERELKFVLKLGMGLLLP